MHRTPNRAERTIAMDDRFLLDEPDPEEAARPSPAAEAGPTARPSEPGARHPSSNPPPKEKSMNRILAALVASVAVGAVLATAALAASWSVSIAGKNVAINPKSSTFAIAVTCKSESDACVGVLDIATASKVKPYRTQPAKVAEVGAFAFDIPAGKTAQVKGRVYGHALAWAYLKGGVKLKIVARASGVQGSLGSKTVLFTLKRKR
jgi:hypothetical protein